MFASWIPEITELAAQRNKYGGKYNKDVRKRYTGKRCTTWLNLCFLMISFWSFRPYHFNTTNLFAIYYSNSNEWNSAAPGKCCAGRINCLETIATGAQHVPTPTPSTPSSDSFKIEKSYDHLFHWGSKLLQFQSNVVPIEIFYVNTFVVFQSNKIIQEKLH